MSSSGMACRRNPRSSSDYADVGLPRRVFPIRDSRCAECQCSFGGGPTTVVSRRASFSAHSDSRTEQPIDGSFNIGRRQLSRPEVYRRTRYHGHDGAIGVGKRHGWPCMHACSACSTHYRQHSWATKQIEHEEALRWHQNRNICQYISLIQAVKTRKTR